MIEFDEVDLTVPAPLPEDLITFGPPEDLEPERPDLSGPAIMIAMLREAKEKHMAVLFTNEDETRGLLVKDANNLNLKITVNGVPFEEI